MKSIGRDDKIRRKYQRKEEYLLHFQIFDYFIHSIGVIIPITLFWFIGVYFVNGEYPSNIGALDVTLFILSLWFIFYLKPRMLKGKIKAYYRRDYNDIRYLLLVATVVIQGALLRVPVFMGLYALNYKLADSAVVKANYLRQMKDFLFDPKMTLIAVVFFGTTIYLSFFSEKYVTIKEFSNSVVDIIKNQGIGEEGATVEFISRKDHYYQIDKFENIKYENNESVETKQTDSRGKPIQEFINIKTNKKDKKKDEETIIIPQVRRKSRRL